MEETKPPEEIYLSKIKGYWAYDIAHVIPGDNNSSEELNFFLSIDYYKIIWYLRGALFGKNSNKLNLHNGMPDDIKNKYTLFSLSNTKTYPLKSAILEEILSDIGIKENKKDPLEWQTIKKINCV